MEWPLRDGVIVALASAAASIVLVHVTRRVAAARGWTAPVRGDRWHKEATPLFGGVAIALAFGLAIAFARGIFESFRDASGSHAALTLALIGGALLAGAVGLLDDLLHFRPSTKLSAQIACACVFLWGCGGIGITGNAALDTTIEILWIVGLMNALNMLDNMDGVAATAATVALAGFAVASALAGGGVLLITVALAGAGATAGFLAHNLPRARIFMGDSGSLMLGFLVAALTLLGAAVTDDAHEGARGGVLAALVAALGFSFVPLLDMAVVSVTRVRRGQSPMTGGRDHTTHRLATRGWSGWGVVALVACVALGAAAIAVAATARFMVMSVAAVFLCLAFAGLAASLVRMAIRMDTAAHFGAADRSHRRAAWEPFAKAALDLALIALSLFVGYLVRWGWQVPPELANSVGWSLPVTIACCVAVNSGVGDYWRQWHQSGMRGAVRAALAALGGALLSMVLVAALWTPDRLFSRLAMAAFALAYPLLVFAVRLAVLSRARSPRM